MELKKEELSRERRTLGAAGPAADEGHGEELDPVDIEILLTSGHYDDCCHS